MNIRELTCIGCPMGCQLRATLEDGVVTAVTGNTCPRGDAYARKECVHPERTVTGTVRVLGGPLPVVPVRTQGEVPKEKVLEVARALHHAAVPAPVQAGQVLGEIRLLSGDKVVWQSALVADSDVPALTRERQGILEFIGSLLGQ